MKQYCYNCGLEILGQVTVEHIPAQNLYSGYGEEFKKNRVTVPACEKCNNSFSKIDQELRDAIGVQSEGDVKDAELTRKSVKSILRRPNWRERLDFKTGGMYTVTFSYDELKQLHIKNFKGIFFHEFRYPLPEYFHIQIIADGDEDKIDYAGSFYQFLGGDIDWKISGHQNVFKYKIKMFTANNRGEIVECADLQDAIGIVSIQVYHNKLMSTGCNSKLRGLF